MVTAGPSGTTITGTFTGKFSESDMPLPGSLVTRLQLSQDLAGEPTVVTARYVDSVRHPQAQAGKWDDSDDGELEPCSSRA